MLLRVCTATLLVLLGLTLPALGQTTLEWKFKEGDKFYVEEVNDVKQSFSIIGKEIKKNTKITTLIRYVVKSVAGKEVVLDQKIESVDVKSMGDDPGQMDKLFEKLQGATFQVTLKDGKVSRFNDYADFIKKLAKGDDETAKFAKMLMSEETFKKSNSDLFGGLPSRKIKLGDTWFIEASVPFGPLGSFKTNKDMTFREKDKDGVLITYQSKMTYMPPKGDEAFAGLLKIVKSNIKSDSANGSVLFDPETGRLVRSTFSMKARGSLTVEVMGNQLEMDMNVDQTSTIRVLTRNPKVK